MPANWNNYTGERPGMFYDPNFGRYLPSASHAGHFVNWQTGQASMGGQPTYANPDQQAQFAQQVASGSLNQAPRMSQMVNPSTGAAQQNVQTAPQGGGSLRVRMGDGTVQTFNGNFWQDPQLDAALKNGGVPLDPITGEDLAVQDGVNNGFLVKRAGDAFGVPLNVLAGQDLSPEQSQALFQHYGGTGNMPGQGQSQNPPQQQSGYPGAPLTGTGMSGDAILDSPFMQAYPNAFRPTNASDLSSDPGYQFRMQEGMKALERSGSARGMLLSGDQLQGVQRFSQGLASQEFGNVDARRARDYDRDVNMFFTTQNNRGNRVAAGAYLNQNPSSSLPANGSNYANNSGNILTGNAANQADAVTNNANITAGQNLALAQNRGSWYRPLLQLSRLGY